MLLEGIGGDCGEGQDLRLREEILGATVITRFEELIALRLEFLGHCIANRSQVSEIVAVLKVGLAMIYGIEPFDVYEYEEVEGVRTPRKISGDRDRILFSISYVHKSTEFQSERTFGIMRCKYLGLVYRQFKQRSGLRLGLFSRGR